MAVRFLDVNGIFEKRIIMTFGKCTRQLQSNLVDQYVAMSDVHAMVLQSLVILLQAKPRSR